LILGCIPPAFGNRGFGPGMHITGQRMTEAGTGIHGCIHSQLSDNGCNDTYQEILHF
jgi:hypothetical protein